MTIRHLPGRPARRVTRVLTGHPVATAAAAGVAVLAVTALVNHRLARAAERRDPPQGRFLEIDGVRLHYVAAGHGPTLVLLHGNGSMIQDFASSGLLAQAAERYRVIAFDRPGFGHSSRPRGTLWSPDRQAALIGAALAEIGSGPAIVLGHSWGAAVAMALAQRDPARVRALVLASGYYYPSLRFDAAAMSAPAVPVLGDILRYTLAPLAGRLLWPAMLRKIFGPREVPRKFSDGFPEGLALRPSQLRASAAESALMVPAALQAQGGYQDLAMPVVIIAGDRDRIVDIERQSLRLHGEIAHSLLRILPGSGHMIHQTDTEAVLAAIDTAAGQAPRLSAAG